MMCFKTRVDRRTLARLPMTASGYGPAKRTHDGPTLVVHYRPTLGPTAAANGPHALSRDNPQGDVSVRVATHQHVHSSEFAFWNVRQCAGPENETAGCRAAAAAAARRWIARAHARVFACRGRHVPRPLCVAARHLLAAARVVGGGDDDRPDVVARRVLALAAIRKLLLRHDLVDLCKHDGQISLRSLLQLDSLKRTTK